MEYRDGIEKQAGVQKKEVAKEKFLFFVPEGEKFVFCSNDAHLQKWCEGVKTKKVKKEAIKFVVGAAKQVLSGNVAKNNGQQAKNNGLQKPQCQSAPLSDKSAQVKKVDWLQENMILANFNSIFGIKKEDWVTRQDGYDKAGRAMSRATLKFNDKVYSEKAYSNKEAMREVVINILDESYNTNIRKKQRQQELNRQKQEEARYERWRQMQDAENARYEKRRQMQDAEKAKYYKTLMERSDVEVVATRWEDVYQYNVITDYGIPQADYQIEIADGIYVNPFESEDIPLDMIKKANPSKEERKSFNDTIDKLKQEHIDTARKMEHLKGLKERMQKKKEAQFDNASIDKKLTDQEWQYQIQMEDGTKYVLDISFDVISQEKRKYREIYDDCGDKDKELIEAKNVDMKTLTVGYQKISGDQKEEFSVQASTPHLNTTNEALGRMLRSNMKVASKTVDDEKKKEQLGVLRKLLEISKDPLVMPNKQNAQAISKSARENR